MSLNNWKQSAVKDVPEEVETEQTIAKAAAVMGLDQFATDDNADDPNRDFDDDKDDVHEVAGPERAISAICDVDGEDDVMVTMKMSRELRWKC